MRSFSVIVLLTLVLQINLAAQQPSFSPANVTLPQLGYSACAWGDYDHDGDLDLALNGTEGNNPVTKILRNDNGNFTDIQANLFALHYGSVEWGDYNNDGDLDLLITGMDNLGNSYTIIYKNTAGIFTDSGISLPGTMDGQASWGDFNNDGNLDILLAGSLMARIYRNEGNGQFTNINAPFPNMETAMCCWNDYNNDGQSDVLVCGNTGGGIVTKLFKNNHGVFTEVILSPEPLLGLYGGQAKWADLDNDGDQDLVIAGSDLYVDGHFIFYRNDNFDHFTKFEVPAANLLNPYFDMEDYDADGLIDVMLIGSTPGCGGPPVTMLLKNTGSFCFTPVSTLIPGFKLGGVCWGDYNNDGYSDLLLTGLDAFDVPQTTLFLNNLGDTAQFVQNTPPQAPLGLGVTIESNRVVLHWDNSIDLQTPGKALSYNVCIGTLPEASDVLSPLANLNTGNRMVSALGNANSDTSWIISGMPSGTYYFSVQAIDNGFMPGTFSAPKMFDYLSVDIKESEGATFNLYPNPCSDKFFIGLQDFAGSSLENYNQKFSYTILNPLGKIISQGRNSRFIDTYSWPSGIYIMRFNQDGLQYSRKLIKE